MPPPAVRVVAATQALEGCRAERVLATTPSTFRFAAIFQALKGWTPSYTEGRHAERASAGLLPTIRFTAEL